MGVDAWGFPGGLLRLDPAFAYVKPPSSWPLPWAECLTPDPNRRSHGEGKGYPLLYSLVKAMVFPVVRYGCESWTLKKAEHRRIDAFEQWCWRRLLRVPWTARRSNQSILKEITAGCSLKGLMLKLKTPILWPPHAKSWLIGKDPDVGKGWRQEEKGTTEDEMAGWHHQLNGHEFGWTLGVGDGQGGLACCDSWGRKKSDTIEWVNWTEQHKIKNTIFLTSLDLKIHLQ